MRRAVVSVLAVDTSSRRRALCVLATRDGALLDHRALPGRHLDRELPPALAGLLRDDLSAVACVLGPGSYTGLRVGVAAALGIAHARDLPLFGIGALDVVARAAGDSDSAVVEAVADAGRGALYVARYRCGGPEIVPAGAPRRVDAAGWTPAPGALAVSLDGISGTRDAVHAAPAALAAAAAAAARGRPLARTGLEPMYLGGGTSAAPDPRV